MDLIKERMERLYRPLATLEPQSGMMDLIYHHRPGTVWFDRSMLRSGFDPATME